MYKVLVGYAQNEGDKGALELLTTDGIVVEIPRSAIHKTQHVGGGSDKDLVRVFVKKGSTVKVSISVDEVGGGQSGPGTRTNPLLDDGWGTGYKYYDDGGTIRKSYDDI